MSWLYDHRDQADGLSPLIEIAHWVVTSHVRPEDRDDVEQEIVINLMETIQRYGDRGDKYLKAVAWSGVCKYLREKYQQQKLRHIGEKERWGFSRDGDHDARLDAMVILATLPQRLIEIGYKIMDGEKLSEADISYWRRQKEKLNCPKWGNRVSDWEKRRILQLHREGMSMCKIARTMGRTNKAVMRVLAGNNPVTRRQWLAKMKAAAEERDENIRRAYFIDGESIHHIRMKFHYGEGAVRRAIKAPKPHPEICGDHKIVVTTP